jgi:putative addiction module CopG family antidote
MEVNLTHDHEAFIARSVREGRFASPDDAVREAVELLARQEAELHSTRAFVKAGLDDLDSGNYEDFADESLRGLFSGAESRGRQRLAAERLP